MVFLLPLKKKKEYAKILNLLHKSTSSYIILHYLFHIKNVLFLRKKDNSRYILYNNRYNRITLEFLKTKLITIKNLL